MLFVYPEHVVHMVECSWELVEAILRDALTQAQSSRFGGGGGGGGCYEKLLFPAFVLF